MIEKVKQIAREKYGKELTDEQAAKYAERLGKLSDDELENVSGGSYACASENGYGKYCEPCEVCCDKEIRELFAVFKCPKCGTVYR